MNSNHNRKELEEYSHLLLQKCCPMLSLLFIYESCHIFSSKISNSRSWRRRWRRFCWKEINWSSLKLGYRNHWIAIYRETWKGARGRRSSNLHTKIQDCYLSGDFSVGKLSIFLLENADQETSNQHMQSHHCCCPLHLCKMNPTLILLAHMWSQ